MQQVELSEETQSLFHVYLERTRRSFGLARSDPFRLGDLYTPSLMGRCHLLSSDARTTPKSRETGLGSP